MICHVWKTLSKQKPLYIPKNKCNFCGVIDPIDGLRNSATIELICFVTHIKYQINERRISPCLSKATWPVVMAMDIVAMVSYIYYGKSVVQVLSPWRKVWDWDSSLGLNMPSRYSGGRALSNPFV